jgi:hypothetical protein
VPPQKPAVQQSDPWAEAAKNFKAQPQSEAAPTGGNDDWKVWQQNDSAPDAQQRPGLTGIDPHRAIHSMADAGREGVRALGNIGSGGLGLLSTVGRMTPIGAADDYIEGRPTIYQDAYQAVKHPWDTMQSMGHSAQEHPLETLEQTIGGMGAGAALGKAGMMAEEAVPSRARAAGNLNTVMQTVGNKPVTLSRTLPELESAQKLSLWKHGNVPALDDLYNRMNTVNPIDFEEAKGRYEPISKLTANDRMNTTGKLQGQTKRVAGAMRADLVDSAEQAHPGMGDLFDKGMTEYRRAAQMAETGKNALKYGLPIAAGGGLLGTVLRKVL